MKDSCSVILGNRNFGGKTHRAILEGKRTVERPLQNHFWRPQKVGFVWAVPVSSKENRGKRIIGRGGPTPFWGRGFMVCHPLP